MSCQLWRLMVWPEGRQGWRVSVVVEAAVGVSPTTSGVRLLSVRLGLLA